MIMKRMRLIIICIIFAASVPLVAFAQTKISLSIPGSNIITTSTQPGYIISNFYQFALLIGGLLAFGAVVYGGVKYVTSGGNPSSQGEAKEWIQSALLGLLLLVCAYLILATINPNLVHLDLPMLQQVSISGPTGGGGGGSPPVIGSPPDSGCVGGNCVTLPNCTQTKATTGPGAVNCGGTPAIAAILNCINKADPNYTVAEGYPPAVGHSDPGHALGCAVDVHVTSCAGVTQFAAAAASCGAPQPLNEYNNPNKGLYCPNAVPPPKTYQHTTGGNIHIDAPGCP